MRAFLIFCGLIALAAAVVLCAAPFDAPDACPQATPLITGSIC